MARLTKSDERAVQRWLANTVEGPTRYRPGKLRGRFGLQFELQVRVGLGSDTEWVKRTRWFTSQAGLSDCIVRTRMGYGLLGDQLSRGWLRRLKVVTR